jgi:DinB superfamily
LTAPSALPEREFWLRGPVTGVPPMLQPAAHAFLQAQTDLRRASAGLSAADLWRRPGGAASVGFHLRHAAGSVDRLLTYAAGKALTPSQLAALRAESATGDPAATVDALLAGLDRAIDHALNVLRATPAAAVYEARAVGRERLPTTVIGLLFHAAEHAQRHAGQAITTAAIVRGGPARD